MKLQKKLQEKEHHTEQSERDPLESSDNFADLDSDAAVDLDKMKDIESCLFLSKYRQNIKTNTVKL